MKLNKIHENLDTTEFNPNTEIAYNNPKSKITIIKQGDKYSYRYNNKEIAILDEYDAELNSSVDVIIGPTGTTYYDDTNYPYASHSKNFTTADNSWIGQTLYKATTNTNKTQIPGFMTNDTEEVKRYLPKGDRHKHYGGKNLISYTITE